PPQSTLSRLSPVENLSDLLRSRAACPHRRAPFPTYAACSSIPPHRRRRTPSPRPHTPLHFLSRETGGSEGPNRRGADKMIGVGKAKQYANVLDKPLSRGRQEVSLSAFAFLFSELVQYNQTQVDNIAELERRLEDAGYAVGARVLELLCHREKGNRRETRLLGILSFIHSTVWKVLFGKVADSLEKGTEHEDEYMISEKELLVNRFISVPKDMGAFNCGAFVAGIVKGVLDNAGFPAVVTAHFVPIEGQQRPRTTILIKFAEEVLHREARLG
ncbi:unnamed protein product, partial [Urochloa humidicola]